MNICRIKLSILWIVEAETYLSAVCAEEDTEKRSECIELRDDTTRLTTVVITAPAR